jgi:cytochrome c
MGNVRLFIGALDYTNGDLAMKNVKVMSVLMFCGMLGGVVAMPTIASADDGEEFKAVLKQNDCFKCHAIDKTKKGPAYKKIAAKYKGKEAEGIEKIIKNITTGPKVKLEDGTEEEHKIIDIKDQEELKKLARWILSL